MTKYKMVSAEMVGIILTGTISGIELLTSLTGILLSGNLQFECCCLKVSHKDTESELIQEMKEVRRMSSPPPPPPEPVSVIQIT